MAAINLKNTSGTNLLPEGNMNIAFSSSRGENYFRHFVRESNTEGNPYQLLVKTELANLGLLYFRYNLKEVEIPENVTEKQLEQLKIQLQKMGLDLMVHKKGKKNILTEKIKTLLNEIVYRSDELPKVKYSHYLSEKLNYDYTYISHIFSEVTGLSIRKYIIQQRIERVKELLYYEDLTLSEIAFKLSYSSVAHLSNQFKQITGSIPSKFKRAKDEQLIAI
jgi:AraC-like DNA-binding protein